MEKLFCLTKSEELFKILNKSKDIDLIKKFIKDYQEQFIRKIDMEILL